MFPPPTNQPVLDLFKLDGKCALVSGGNGGIGFGMVSALAEAGADILITKIPSDDASKTEKYVTSLGRKFSAYECDLGQSARIRECVQKILKDGHTIDILINCAGISGHHSILDVADEFREKVLNVNLNAVYVLTQEVGRHMIERGRGGKVLNVSSLAGMIATKNISIYAGTKGAVNSLTSAFANEWAEYNIQVNCVCPAYILTPLTQKLHENEDFKKWSISRCPAGRWGLPEDFKGLTVFFCSNASNYVTGVRMPMDGGMHGF